MSPRPVIGQVVRLVPIVCVLLACAVQPVRASCGAESCPIDNSIYERHARRLSIDVSYQYVDQDRLRTGTEHADQAAVLVNGGEVRTVSRLTTVRAAGSFGGRWTVSALLPFVDRMHQHVTAEGLPTPELREWKYGGVGDLTLLGAWTALDAGPDSRFTFGLQGGVKLPTGRREVPEIEGETPEPHARPGTGSTDLLGGFLTTLRLTLPTLTPEAGETAVFASALYTYTGRGTDHHRIGRSVEGQIGATHPLLQRLRVIAQVNVRNRGKDHNDAAEAVDDHDHGLAPEQAQHLEHAGIDEDTGGTSVFASPGLRFDVNPVVALSGYVQIPVYQRVNGTQLAAPSQFWFGATYRLR